MILSIHISRIFLNVKSGGKVEVKMYASIFQPVKGEAENFIFKIYKESSKIEKINFTIEQKWNYYKGMFRAVIESTIDKRRIRL